MADVPATRASLLLRLRDAADAQAWGQFVRLYGPAVYEFGRRKGLQDADAADLMQEVMRSVAGAVGRLDYDPAKGAFRGWLFTLAHRRLHDFLAKRRDVGSGDTGTLALLHEYPARDDEQLWNDDVERRLFAVAAEEIRPLLAEATWQAFWQTAVEGKKPKDVAEALGLSVAAVYLAKSRVMVRLKERIQMLSRD